MKDYSSLHVRYGGPTLPLVDLEMKQGLFFSKHSLKLAENASHDSTLRNCHHPHQSREQGISFTIAGYQIETLYTLTWYKYREGCPRALVIIFFKDWVT